MVSLADDPNRRQLLAAMLAGAGGAATPDLPDDQPDEYAAPVPTQPGSTYQPLINPPPPRGYSPPYGPPANTPGGPTWNKPRPNGALAAALAAPPGAHYAQLPGPPLLLPGDGGAAPDQPMPAIAAASPEGAQDMAQPTTDIAGKMSDMGESQVTPEQEEIYRMRQNLRTQEQGLRAQIAGATNPEIAKVYADQLGRLSSYDQQLETAYLATIRGQQETTKTLSPEEAKAAGLTDGVYQRDAKGAISRVTGTEEAKDTTEVQNYKFDQQNRQAQGLPPISFSDWNTQKTMYGKGERPLVDATGKEIDSKTTGDELLQALPPAVANHAKAIAEIREKWPSGTEQARQPQLQQALAAAQQLDPSLNQQTFATRQSMKNAAESGSGRINVANLANNTALFHSNTLADAIVELNNSNNTILNATVNSGAGPTGGIIPGATNKADAVKQFSVARDAVANELERSFHGVGTTAEQAVKRQIDDLSVNDAPQTQLGALKAAQDLLKGKITANEADYRDTMGDRNIAAWERDHGRPFGFITPAAEAAGDRVASMYQSVRGGKGFHGFEPQGTPSPVQQPAPRNVAPDVTGAPQRKGVYVPGKGIQWQ